MTTPPTARAPMPVPTRSDVPTLPTLAELEAAAALVHAAMPPTPQYRWPLLEARTGVETWVKHENPMGTHPREHCEHSPWGA